ncbi:hypothetical protein [Rhizobium esperanzae]|uniref:hypothetical protein n=1 Tax=Rhizobium esperanzae TaxID=1967781 RepID=UPI001595A308|nr:hypothetical protein [Rhizobium esperanzae]
MLKSIANKILDILCSKEWNPQLRNRKLLMRRRVPGGWEYREMTSEEMEDLIAWHVMK